LNLKEKRKMNIFVGNLPFLATENEVKSVFEAFGTVSSVSIKKKSGQNSRGFGFVSMPDDLQAQAAIAGLQNKDFMGRPLNVSIERPKVLKPKKDYKEIKKLRLEAKNKPSAVFVAPIIHEKEVDPKAYKESKKEDTPSRRIREDAKKFSEPAGAQAWEKRKGRGTAKPWKKKPGGVNKKFKYAR
jgi:RNA recognition motif-containing protein